MSNPDVVAIVISGIGTILVVIFVAWLWPEMRRLSTLREISHETVKEPRT